MTFFERLMQETKSDRDAFQSISLIQTAVCQGVDKDLYVAFLKQAYHHVKFTCPLLGAALSRVGQNDGLFRTALIEYIDEEKGHEEWILDDIEAFGGDRQMVVNQAPNISTNVMCGYAFYAIEHVSPYALLGHGFMCWKACPLRWQPRLQVRSLNVCSLVMARKVFPI